MNVEVANLVAAAELPSNQVEDVTDGEVDPFLYASGLVRRAEAIEARLATWTELVPSNWAYVTVPKIKVPQNVINAGFYGNTCDVYLDIAVSRIWNDWRCARLRILAIVAQNDTQGLRIQVMHTIQQLVDEVCATIPYNLGSKVEPASLYDEITFPQAKQYPLAKSHSQTSCAVGGWVLLNPLQEMLKVATYLRQGQAQWIGSQLYRLEKIYDVRRE